MCKAYINSPNKTIVMEKTITADIKTAYECLLAISSDYANNIISYAEYNERYWLLYNKVQDVYGTATNSVWALIHQKVYIQAAKYGNIL
jgi:hypothetical protein